LDSLRWQIYEITHEDEITETERKMKERMAKGTHKAPRKKKAVTNG
jgi:hypothetical protein